MYAKIIDLIPFRPRLRWAGGVTLDDFVLPSITVENKDQRIRAKVSQMSRLEICIIYSPAGPDRR